MNLFEMAKQLESLPSISETFQLSSPSDPGRITDPVKALSFILAGNAYFTVRSVKTGARYTYRVSKPKGEPRSQWSPTHFVSLLTGPQNTDDYTYLGSIRTSNSFQLTKASKMTADSVPVKAFMWLFNHLTSKTFPPQTEVWHEGRCGRCGRKLTVPESVAAGIGPECAGKM